MGCKPELNVPGDPFSSSIPIIRKHDPAHGRQPRHAFRLETSNDSRHSASAVSTFHHAVTRLVNT